MTGKRLLGLLGSVCLALVLAALPFMAACVPEAPPEGAPSTVPSKEVYEFKFSQEYPEGSSFYHSVTYFWAKELEEASEGRIKMKFFPAQSLVKAADQWEAVVSGIADMSQIFFLYEVGRWPISEYGFLPFMFPDNRVASMTMTALYNKYPCIQEEFKDVHVLWLNANAPAQISNKIRPVHTLEDLKGLKLEGSGKYFKDLGEYLGFTPVSLTYPEVYDALAKGTLDGDTIEWEGTWAYKWYEQDKYYTEVSYSGKTGFYLTPFVVAMNKEKWESLPPDIKAIFNAYSGLRGAEMCGYLFDVWGEHCREAISRHAERAGKPPIYELPDSEKERLIEATQPVREKWLKEMEEKGVDGEAILADAEKLVEVFSAGPKPWFYTDEQFIEAEVPCFMEEFIEKHIK